MAAFLIVSGVVLLWLGGEALVRFATRLASLLGMSPLMVGLTVVAFATSAPELFASVVAGMRGSPDIAFGNVVGSNIANVGLILGLSGLMVTLHTEVRLVRRELPFMAVIAASFVVLVRDGVVDRVEGSVLLFALALYLWALRRELTRPDVDRALVDEVTEELEHLEGGGASLPKTLGGVALGVVLLVIGARLMVDGSIRIAGALGISERVIGLTIVSFGTSLPELASCIVAAARKAPDLILGNIVGSNIMNVLIVLAVTALIAPIPVDAHVVRVDLAIMIGLSALTIPLFATGLRLHRFEAALLLTVYAGYITYLARTASA